MPLALLLVLILVASCVPETDERTELHDIAIYNFAGDYVYGYFFGAPEDLQSPTRELVLTEGRSDDDYAVDGALLVNGEPYLKNRIAALPELPFEVTKVPLSTDLMLRARGETGPILYFDGEHWFEVADRASPGMSTRVVPRERIGGLRGVAGLRSAEAAMLERVLREQAPVVIGFLPEAPGQPRQVAGLDEYRRTALVVQEGLATDVTAAPPPVREVGWEVLAQGNQAATGESPEFHVAASEDQLHRLWNRAYGRQLNVPTVPRIDFRRDTVVAFFLGQKPTGGYGVDVQGVTIEGNEVYISVRISEPAEDAIVTQALTSPWVMVRVPRPNVNVAWFRDDATGQLIGVARRTM